MKKDIFIRIDISLQNRYINWNRIILEFSSFITFFMWKPISFFSTHIFPKVHLFWTLCAAINSQCRQRYVCLNIDIIISTHLIGISLTCLEYISDTNHSINTFLVIALAIVYIVHPYRIRLWLYHIFCALNKNYFFLKLILSYHAIYG